jgi:hypothetical protein
VLLILQSIIYMVIELRFVLHCHQMVLTKTIYANYCVYTPTLTLRSGFCTFTYLGRDEKGEHRPHMEALDKHTQVYLLRLNVCGIPVIMCYLYEVHKSNI